MKRLVFLSALFLFGLTAMANGPVNKLSKDQVKEMTKSEHLQRMKVLENRVTEIRDIPLSTLSNSDKKDLKSELNYIRKEMKMHENAYGLYISGGALLVIILLILLL